jgi:hypothetical protein
MHPVQWSKEVFGWRLPGALAVRIGMDHFESEDPVG